MFDCFLSYQHDDLVFVETLAAELERRGLSCWYAPRNVSGSYAKAIADGIRQSQLFVLILNDRSAVSEAVLNEVELAHNHSKISGNAYIQPVCTQTLNLNDPKYEEMMYYIRRRHFISAGDPPNYGEITDAIIHALFQARKLAEERVGSSPAAKAPNVHDVLKTIELYRLPVSEHEFCAVCTELDVPISVEKDRSVFITENPQRVIDYIKTTAKKPIDLMLTEEKEKKAKWLPFVIAGAVVILVLLLILLLPKSGKENSVSTEPKTSQSEPTKTAETGETPPETTAEPIAETTGEAEPVLDTENSKSGVNGLEFSVDSVNAYGASLKVTVGDRDFALGWVDQPVITAKTDKGTYNTTVRTQRYLKNQTYTLLLDFDSMEGTLEEITVTSVIRLNDSGLPEDVGSVMGKTVTIPVIWN